MKALWLPSNDFVTQTSLHEFKHWLFIHHQLMFDDYASLWTWSTTHVSLFWEYLLDYFTVEYEGDYLHALTGKMPTVNWFEGIKLNYAQHIFRQKDDSRPAILFQQETGPLHTITWQQLTHEVSALQQFFIEAYIQPGDCIAAYLPNIPQAVIGFLAASSLGAVWSSCSPDFGLTTVIERLQQIAPKILILSDTYNYKGQLYTKTDAVKTLLEALPSIEKVVLISNGEPLIKASHIFLWHTLMQRTPTELIFVQVPFAHPLWVLYSSGTTGKPKAITHSTGGMLLEHLKYLSFHNNVKRGERFFWYSSTGWMMWNFSVASLLVGATLVLYDGHPYHPDDGVLWRLVEDAKINHFGTSASYLIACQKKELLPNTLYDLSSLVSLGSTGSPLPAESFRWVYQHIKSDIWLCSMSGGTDVCTAFVGGCPERSVYEGEIQSRALGCALYAWDNHGQAVYDSLGEMVITEPMPCMPIFFWGDLDNKRYLASYFDLYKGYWCHGDYISITPHDGVIIYGRSDATLNRNGIRIGTAEIYTLLDTLPEISDALIVNIEQTNGTHYMPLFVVTTEPLSAALKQRISDTLRTKGSARHVPDDIIETLDIPYTLSGKKMEAPVKKILMGWNAADLINKDTIRNPSSLAFFEEFSKTILAR